MTFFTAAIMHDETCQMFLVWSDTKVKPKDIAAVSNDQQELHHPYTLLSNIIGISMLLKKFYKIEEVMIQLGEVINMYSTTIFPHFHV